MSTRMHCSNKFIAPSFKGLNGTILSELLEAMAKPAIAKPLCHPRSLSISLLSSELLIQILRYLPMSDLVRASSTNRSWHTLSQKQVLWAPIIERYSSAGLIPETEETVLIDHDSRRNNLIKHLKRNLIWKKGKYSRKSWKSLFQTPTRFKVGITDNIRLTSKGNVFVKGYSSTCSKYGSNFELSFVDSSDGFAGYVCKWSNDYMVVCQKSYMTYYYTIKVFTRSIAQGLAP